MSRTWKHEPQKKTELDWRKKAMETFNRRDLREQIEEALPVIRILRQLKEKFE